MIGMTSDVPLSAFANPMYIGRWAAGAYSSTQLMKPVMFALPCAPTTRKTAAKRNGQAAAGDRGGNQRERERCDRGEDRQDAPEPHHGPAAPPLGEPADGERARRCRLRPGTP